MRLVLGLVAVASAVLLGRALLAPPDYGRPPRLAAVVDGGKMEEFLETPEEKATILRWVEDGARESSWPDVAAVLESRCTNCHFAGASFETLPLDDYDHAAGAARVRPLLLEKITGGTMGEYLETREAQAVLVDWIEDGATEPRWPEAKAVIDAHCLHCHNPEGVQGIVSLQTFGGVSRLASLPPAAPRPVAAPGIALLASLVGLAVPSVRRRVGARKVGRRES